jgi:hypothetical protein
VIIFDCMFVSQLRTVPRNREGIFVLVVYSSPSNDSRIHIPGGLYRRYKSEDERVVRSDRRNRLRTKHRNGMDCCWIEGAEIKKQRLPEFGSEMGTLRKYQSGLVPLTIFASVHRT